MATTKSSYARFMEDDEVIAPNKNNNKSTSSAYSGIGSGGGAAVDRSRHYRAGDISPWTGKGRPNSSSTRGDANGGNSVGGGYESPTFRNSSGNNNNMSHNKHMPSPFDVAGSGYTDPRAGGGRFASSASAVRAGSHNNAANSTFNATLPTMMNLSSAASPIVGGQQQQYQNNYNNNNNNNNNNNTHQHMNHTNNHRPNHQEDVPYNGLEVDSAPRYHHPSAGPTASYPYSFCATPHGGKGALGGGKRQGNNNNNDHHNNGRGGGGNDNGVDALAAAYLSGGVRGEGANPSAPTIYTADGEIDPNASSYRAVAAAAAAQQNNNSATSQQQQRSVAASNALYRLKRGGGGGGGVQYHDPENAAFQPTTDYSAQQHLNQSHQQQHMSAMMSNNSANRGGLQQNEMVKSSGNNSKKLVVKNFTASAAAKAPFATHYHDSKVMYESFQPTEATELMDRYGYHYEGLGDKKKCSEEDAAVAAERSRRDRDYAQQLLSQMDDKKRRAAYERDEALHAESITQPTIGAIGADAERRAMKSKIDRKKLEAEWLVEAAAKKERDVAERALLKPWEEDWNILEEEARRRELHGLSEQERRRAEEALRRQNWHSEQEGIAAERKAIEDEKKRIEELTLGPNVANYADRILLAEEQRKRDQQRYKEQLDQQVREKHLKNKMLAAEQYELECRLGSY